MSKYKVNSAFLGVLFILSTAMQAQTHHSKSPDVGVVHFPITAERPSTQQDFDRAMALLHSFWYSSALKEFHEITTREPNCAMAYWGIAMSHFHMLWEPPTSTEIDYAWKALRNAKRIGAKTEREKMYIEAVDAFFSDADKTDHRSRLLAYEKAMERITKAYPDDREAAILYALALDATSLKSDKTLANNKKAGEILLKVFEGQPDHPGVAHYIIHSYDSPQLASLGLDAARKYAKIAPAAPHALHMPSHIFVRLGLWDDNVKANIASANTAQDNLRQSDPNATAFDALHALDYIVYGYLQTGQDIKAREVVDRIYGIQKWDKPTLAAAYAMAAIPARFALERRRWGEATALKLQPEIFPWDRYPWVEAVTCFAQTIGAARSGDAGLARKGVDKLTTLKEKSLEKKDAYWASQVEILRTAAEGWTSWAEKKNEEALNLMRSAADQEDATDKHPVTPGSIVPMRELLGDLLLELGQPKQALAEFEASLASSVNRFNGIYGAARAAEMAGEKQKADSYYRKLIALCEKADTSRPELEKAKSYIADR